MTDALFRRIPIEFTQLDIQQLQGPHHSTFGGIFTQYDIADMDHFTHVLKDRVKFHIAPTLLNVTQIRSPGAGPHRDHWSTALNFYFDAGSDSTVFYHEPHAGVTSTGPSYRAFNIQDLTVAHSFTAAPRECWLLNTSRPHSVNISAEGSVRTMLRAVWAQHTFEQIYHSIELL